MNENNVITIFVFVVILYLIMKYLNKSMEEHESWINYRQKPLGNIETAGGPPVNYYRRDRFRKPYRWPACFLTDHPVRHCKHFE